MNQFQLSSLASIAYRYTTRKKIVGLLFTVCNKGIVLFIYDVYIIRKLIYSSSRFLKYSRVELERIVFVHKILEVYFEG